MDLDRSPTYRWSVEEWNRDVAHRANCTPPCGDIAHLYQKAIPAGRVIVDGDVIMEDLTLLKVKLTDNARGALLEAAKATGHSETDTVNRALALYAFLTKQRSAGWEPALKRGEDVRPFGIEDKTESGK